MRICTVLGLVGGLFLIGWLALAIFCFGAVLTNAFGRWQARRGVHGVPAPPVAG